MISVYKILFDGKVVYVGQTSKKIEQRLREHIYHALSRSKNNKFANKIRKHKGVGFSACLIEECATNDEADLRETLWIKHFNTVVDGYNTALGGRTCRGIKHSVEYSRRASERMKGRTHFIAHNKTEEKRDLLRKIRTGMKYSAETCNKISRSKCPYFYEIQIDDETYKIDYGLNKFATEHNLNSASLKISFRECKTVHSKGHTVLVTGTKKC